MLADVPVKREGQDHVHASEQASEVRRDRQRLRLRRREDSGHSRLGLAEVGVHSLCSAHEFAHWDEREGGGEGRSGRE